MKAAYGKHILQLDFQFTTDSLLKNERPIFRWWLISVAIAIRNTYKNRVQPKCAKTLAKALKRQSNTYGVLQAVQAEDCKNNPHIVTTSEVAEGIPVVASKYTRQKGTEKGFFVLSNLFHVRAISLFHHFCGFHFPFGFFLPDVPRTELQGTSALHFIPPPAPGEY